MDPQDVIIAMISLGRKRQETRWMKKLLRARRVALREKARERARLMRKEQRMLAKEAAKRKLVDDFMVFFEAIERNDMENAQHFDEKAIMNAIQITMNGDNGDHGGDNEGFAANYVVDIVLKTGLVLEQKPTADAIVAKRNCDDGCSGNNGGFASDKGGLNNAAPETAQNLSEEATMVASEGTKSDGSTDGGDAGGYGGSS